MALELPEGLPTHCPPLRPSSLGFANLNRYLDLSPTATLAEMPEQFAQAFGALYKMANAFTKTRASLTPDDRLYRFSKRSNNPGAVGDSALVGETGEAAMGGLAGVTADTGTGGRKGGSGVRGAMGVAPKGGSGERAAMGVMALGAGAASEVGTVIVIDFPASSPSSFLTAAPPIA